MSGCEGCSGDSCGTSEGGCRGELPPGMLKVFDINQSTADGTLVFVELEYGSTPPCLRASDREILSQARRMTDGRVFAVVFGGTELKSIYPEIFGCGADSLYHVRDPSYSPYRPEMWADAISALIARIGPSVVLLAATPIGREMAPRIAATVHSGLTADCTGLSMDDRNLTAVRPAFGGTVIAEIQYTGFPQIATVRPGSFPDPGTCEGTGSVIYWQHSTESCGDPPIDSVSSESIPDIEGRRILIALGDGIRDRSLIEVAESVASRMDAGVVCSRALVEKGWMPRSRQVGLSGRTVSPDLYIAFGISGAAQHMAGASGSARIIAVNKDPHAPIHSYADISLIADAGDVLRSMDRKLARSGIREHEGHDFIDMSRHLRDTP